MRLFMSALCVGRLRHTDFVEQVVDVVHKVSIKLLERR